MLLVVNKDTVVEIDESDRVILTAVQEPVVPVKKEFIYVCHYRLLKFLAVCILTTFLGVVVYVIVTRK